VSLKLLQLSHGIVDCEGGEVVRMYIDDIGEKSSPKN